MSSDQRADSAGSSGPADVPLGTVEPHALLLRAPPADQLLYKVMRTEHLLASLAASYVHFNRVDRYEDFPGADMHDGRQLPRDEAGSRNARFVKAPGFSVADYYERCRSRTYACSFSTINSDYIWRNYGSGGTAGKVCVVFRFDRLRAMLNATVEASTTILMAGSIACHQIFSINYGLIDYVDWNAHQSNQQRFPNPVTYTYLKDRRFEEEKEFRISLSALGIGHFVLKSGEHFAFADHLHLSFDYRAAIACGAIDQILHSSDCDENLLRAELRRFGIEKKATR